MFDVQVASTPSGSTAWNVAGRTALVSKGGALTCSPHFTGKPIHEFTITCDENDKSVLFLATKDVQYALQFNSPERAASFYVTATTSGNKKLSGSKKKKSKKKAKRTELVPSDDDSLPEGDLVRDEYFTRRQVAPSRRGLLPEDADEGDETYGEMGDINEIEEFSGKIDLFAIAVNHDKAGTCYLCQSEEWPQLHNVFCASCGQSAHNACVQFRLGVQLAPAHVLCHNCELGGLTCSVCRTNERPEELLLCDGFCGTGKHVSCIPGLDSVPKDSWYCCASCVPRPSSQLMPSE